MSNETNDPAQPLINPLNNRPLSQSQQPGYYPGYSTLGQQDWWDATTKRVVRERVDRIPPIRFFSADELPIIQAVVDRVVPQDDRLAERRIPVLHYLDARLHENRSDGYRYEGMPSDQDAYRLGLQAIERTAQAIHGQSFIKLDRLKQDFLLKSIHDGKELAVPELWAKLPIHHFWTMLVADCTKAYYSHPWAWDEIGFGGPAYPRAYMRLEGGLPEPWEVDEQRYEWQAPIDTISDHAKSARPSDSIQREQEDTH